MQRLDCRKACDGRLAAQGRGFGSWACRPTGCCKIRCNLTEFYGQRASPGCYYSMRRQGLQCNASAEGPKARSSNPSGSTPALQFTQADTSWMQKFTPFSKLSTESVTQLLEKAIVQQIEPGTQIAVEGGAPDRLYIIRAVQRAQGPTRVPAADTQEPAEPLAAVPAKLAEGSVLGYHELLLNESYGYSCVVEEGESVTAWTVTRQDFLDISAGNSEFGMAELEQVSQQLQEAAQKLEEAQTELVIREQRQQVLQPYLVSAPQRGIVGNSKYAARLRKDIVSVAKDPQRSPVLIFGEPGLLKINVAALIHFGSLERKSPMVSLDCGRLKDNGGELFGKGSKAGLLYWLESGTLVLNDMHKLPKALVPKVQQLIRDGTYTEVGADPSSPLQRTQVRIIMISERAIPWMDKSVKVIKQVPLRVRPADIADLQKWFLRSIATRRGGGQIRLSADALKTLENYSFPNNVRELGTIVERAVAQAPAAPGKDISLTDEVFWFAKQAKDRFRVDLLKTTPYLRDILRSSLWPQDINFKFTAYVYPIVVALLMWGPQDRDHNFALNIFWCYWWPIIFLLYPFLGRIWCAVCPFMIYGELVQRWRLSTGAVLRKWPIAELEKYCPWFLFSLFAGILVWEEVWRLDDTAYLSAWLLLLITAGAMVCSALFERRLWCRYLCPIGGMNGMFAKMSMTEVRSKSGVCSGDCTTYSCYKGSPATPPEGLESSGCPLYSHPAQLVDNRNCTLCMECLKACPNRSVEFRLRAPGIDLWTSHKSSISELCLMYMLLGAVYLHRLPELSQQFGINPGLYADNLPHIAASLLILSVPGILIWGVDGVSRMTLKPLIRFQDIGYAYMPLVCGATLAHYLDNFLLEAGRILPVTAATIGFDGITWLPTFTAHPAVVDFLQGTCLLAGIVLSLALTRKIGSQGWKYLWPHAAAQALITAQLWALIV